MKRNILKEIHEVISKRNVNINIYISNRTTIERIGRNKEKINSDLNKIIMYAIKNINRNDGSQIKITGFY